MSFKNILNFFSPKDKTFFPLFEEATNKLTKLSDALHEGVNASKTERENYFKKIDELSESIEKISHKMNIELSKNFITPFDREDIHSLITSIDNVADNLQGAASRMRLYQVDKITKSIRKLTEINLEACQSIDVAVKELKNFKNIKNITEACARINKLENKSDTVYNKAIFEIFENETDAITIIKYKEVLSVLETATDKCKSVAGVLESIAVKHS